MYYIKNLIILFLCVSLTENWNLHVVQHKTEHQKDNETMQNERKRAEQMEIYISSDIPLHTENGTGLRLR